MHTELDHSQGSRRLLVIQSYPAQNAESLAVLLRKFGYDVLAAADGETGVFMAAADPPHLIISEAILADMDGCELCRRLRTHGLSRAVPVLLIGSLESDSTVVTASLEAGANDYLRIPFNPLHLVEKISRSIECSLADSLSRKR